MRPQLLMSLAAMFIVGTLLACICSGTWLLNGEYNVIRSLASMNVVEISGGGGWAIPKGIALYWNGITTALTWNYPFLASEWAMFVKIPLWIVSIGVVWAFLEVFIQVLSGVVGQIRSLIP